MQIDSGYPMCLSFCPIHENEDEKKSEKLPKMEASAELENVHFKL